MRGVHVVLCAGAAIGLCGAIAPVSRGQELANLAPLPKVGSRVRLYSLARPGERITGVLKVVYGDSLVVQPDRDSAVVLARQDLEQVEVRVGERGAERLGTAFAVAGALGGAAVYVNWCRQHPEDCREDAFGYNRGPDCDDNSRLAVPTLLIVGGGLVGWAIGYGLAAPRWKMLGAPTRIGIAPLGTRGLVVGARLEVGRPGRLAWRGP